MDHGHGGGGGGGGEGRGVSESEENHSSEGTQQDDQDSQDVGHLQAEGREGASSRGGTPLAMKPIEYDPTLLQYTDPFGSMKPDVYTDVVPTGKRPSLPPTVSFPSLVDPLQAMCDSILQLLVTSIRTTDRPTGSTNSSISTVTLSDNLFKQFPYFDIVLKTSDGALVPANRIFLARCPNPLEILRLMDCEGLPTLQVPFERDSLVKVLRLLYNSGYQWLEPSELRPEEYKEVVRLFGGSMEGNTLRTLQDHLETFVCSKIFSDAYIKTTNFKTPVHKVILCGRSEYFAKAFSKYFLSSRTGEADLEGTSSAVIVALLDYLYTGRVDWATALDLVVDMLAVANEIRDEVLCEACCHVVGSNIDLANCCFLYCMSCQLSLPELQWYCTRFIVDHYHSVVPSLPGCASLPDGALEEFELMHEALVLNPVGRGDGFGSVREVIGALRETCIGMDERLDEAQEAYIRAVQRGASTKETEHSSRCLQMQEIRVKKLHYFLSVITKRYWT